MVNDITTVRSAAERRAREFLARWDLSFAELIRQAGPVAEAETLLLVGSIAEGLANPLSDIDLLRIGQSGLSHGVLVREAEFEQSLCRLAGGQELNVESWQAADVEQIGGRLVGVLDVIQDPTRFVRLETFSEMEMRLLHRISTGIPLVHPQVAARWRQRLCLDRLADYLVLHWLNLHYTYREDAIAQVQYGDRLTALATLRLSSDALAAAALATVGETHFHPKWRPLLLARRRGELGAATVDGLLPSLFPSLDADAPALLRDAIRLADGVIPGLIGRCPHLVPAMLELGKLVSFVGTLEAAP